MTANFRPAQEDRGPLFPGSSCFPLSPDHKHKSGDSVDGSDGVRWMRKCRASGLLKASLREIVHGDAVNSCRLSQWKEILLKSLKFASWLMTDLWPLFGVAIIVDDGPRTDYRYHTRGKHDQPETSVFSSMIRSAFFSLKVWFLETWRSDYIHGGWCWCVFLKTKYQKRSFLFIFSFLGGCPTWWRGGHSGWIWSLTSWALQRRPKVWPCHLIDQGFEDDDFEPLPLCDWTVTVNLDVYCLTVGWILHLKKKGNWKRLT